MLKVINSRQSVRAWTEKKVAISMNHPAASGRGICNFS